MPVIRRFSRPGWFPRLTLRGLIFLTAGGALFLNALVVNRRDLLFVACVLLAVPLVALVYVAVRPSRLHVTRTFRPPIVAAGSEAVVCLLVQNLSSRPLYGARWRDATNGATKAPGTGQLPPLERYEGGRDNGADSATLEYTILPRQRGVHGIGPLVLGQHDPFGLAFSERRVGEPHDLVVTPRITSLPGAGTALTSGDGSLHEQLRRENPNSDELIAREYRPGDALRRVNWPATARHGEIMVRQEEQRSNPEALLILDTTLSGPREHSLMHGERDRRYDQDFELAVELAASVGAHLLDGGFRLNVAELGASQLAPGLDRERGALNGDMPTAFRAPGGDRQLLEGLANLMPIHRQEADVATGASWVASRGASSQLPAFAILIDINDADAAGLASVRGHCEPAVAFTVGTVRRDMLEYLTNAGWQCITVTSSREITAAWSEVQQQRGVVHDTV
jgi:uncharacterized protein (DUF58 family)